jgi:hypothetical protein
MVQGGGGEPANPLPKSSGPWEIHPVGGSSESILWTRTDARVYYVRPGGGQMQNLMALIIGGQTTHSMAAARYTSNHRQGTPICLVCNLYSGRVTEAADSIFRALSEYIATKALFWPLWQGMSSLDGRARPRGNAGGLRLLDPALYEGTTLYVPAMFGVEKEPPPS